MQIIRSAMFALTTLSLAAASSTYTQHNLVSDQPGIADRQDPNLVNAWGIDRSPTGPWWINANETGLSVVYNGSGAAFPVAKPLVVTIPASGGGTSAPTGIVFNGSQDFQIAAGKPAPFIFATEDGTISGWNPSVNATSAVIMFDSKGAAVYKGIAAGVLKGANVLFAANFRTGLVDMFDASFKPVTLTTSAFHDPAIPAGYAPFNVQNVGGHIAVAYAQQDPASPDEVDGAGKGYVDIFTTEGTLVLRLHHGPWMNAPWAVTVAPADFGKLGKKFLVGNFGSGEIAAFKDSGEFQGFMRGTDGKRIVIDGLWGLAFGNGGTAGAANVLYFAAGPGGEEHGLFGTLTLAGDKDVDDDEDHGNGGGDHDGGDHDGGDHD